MWSDHACSPLYIHLAVLISWQGWPFPVTDLFLEDILEKTRYKIQSEADSFRGNSRRRRKMEQDSKKDPLTELYEVMPQIELKIYNSTLFLSRTIICHVCVILYIPRLSIIYALRQLLALIFIFSAQ